MPDLNIPNLDCMDEDDLRDIAAKLKLLSRYATQKACAMAWRKKGDLHAALLAEGKLDQIYQSLPPDWRW